MLEKSEAVPKNPIETVARLINEAARERLYIDQQDIYPLESQRAARILPAIEEDVERRLEALLPHERETAYRMAELMEKLRRSDTAPQSSGTTENFSVEDILEGLEKIANDESDKGEQ